MSGEQGPAAILPPRFVFQDFLDATDADALYDYACAREADFAPTKIFGGMRLDYRISRGLRDLGRFESVLRERLRAQLPAFTAQLRLSPFELSGIELELVAHEDGAFYRRHIDTRTGDKESVTNGLRVLSAVYYFHRRPKPYTGGALRLFAIGGDEMFVDIEPQHNCLLVFPSWAPHEVRLVRVPSGLFADSRFAINCWFHKKR